MIAVFDISSLFTILFLVFLEGILSMDNALVLALLVKPLPAIQQRRALTWGIWGAFIFRFVSLFFLSTLMSSNWIKLAGGGYLLYLAVKSLVFGEGEKNAPVGYMGFLRVVILVELMDIAFSVDSILAAVSLTQNYFITMAGGVLGICMMRFAAVLFIRLLDVFPGLNKTAFHLVFVIGAKLFVQGMNISSIDFHSSTNPASWLFWGALVSCVVYGLKSKKAVAA